MGDYAQSDFDTLYRMTIGNPLNVMCGEAAHSFPPDFPPSHAGRAPFSAPGLPSD